MKAFFTYAFSILILLFMNQHVKAEEKILVVGAGIVGASIAYHLAIEGVEVIVIDMQAPASHASLGTFAWINASWAKQPKAYHSLNQQSVAYWHPLSKQLNIPVKWGGSLEWFGNPERQEKLSQQIQEQQSWGEPAKMLSPLNAKSLEPKVNFMDVDAIAYSQNDGAVDPAQATNQFLSAAMNNGAKVKYPCKLESITDTTATRVANTTCGPINFNKLVLAVGAASNTITDIAKMDIPQRTTPGIIVVTEPIEPLLNNIIVAPGVHIHQRLDGRVVLGEQAGPPNTSAHSARLQNRPNEYPGEALAQQHANSILDNAIKYVPQLSNAQVENVYIGWRPLPLDGHPVLGFSTEVPYVYIAVTHSGVTLAPILGRMVSQELIGNKSIDALSRYRPSRQFEKVKRY
jgi:glycine/D-amino acid oxidase-like deaminating enzyme